MPRKFYVWCNDANHTLEMPDDATDEDCEAACKDTLDTLIGNVCDTGWNEIMPNGTEK